MTLRPVLVAATLAAIAGGVEPAFGQATLYENFSAPALRADRWRTDQFESGPGSGLETLRLVTGGTLLLAHRVAGDRTTDVGSHISAARLFFNTPAGGGLKFDVAMLAVAAVGCTTPGANFTDVEARGWTQLFFNGVDVVSAVIALVRLSDVDEVHAVGALPGIGGVDLGVVAVGAPVSLRLNWDRANNRVDFQRNDNPVQSVAYDLDDSLAVESPFVVFEAVAFVPSCTAATAPTGVVTALFDNVFINP
jgi:hypothetical protein